MTNDEKNELERLYSGLTRRFYEADVPDDATPGHIVYRHSEELTPEERADILVFQDYSLEDFCRSWQRAYSGIIPTMEELEQK